VNVGMLFNDGIVFMFTLLIMMLMHFLTPGVLVEKSGDDDDGDDG
jgi:hypothetical protein